MFSNLPALQHQPWPAVLPFSGTPHGFADFLRLTADQQRRSLAALRADPAAHSATLHQYLATVSAYIFGYADSPVHQRADDAEEIAILQAKTILERELLEHWLDADPVPEGLTQASAVVFLSELTERNSSLTHPLFDFIRDEADRAAIAMFLRNEVARNEVVDDEVAMMLVGLQGPMKLAVASNLWDECGRGKLSNFHTYWLRRLLERTGDWDGIKRYRDGPRPWAAQITTNVFNILLTRPGIRLMAYGWFLINESWVAPHFERVLAGMRRVGLEQEDITIYFTAHVSIDPRHTGELLDAVAAQAPELSAAEATQLARGAQLAIAASTAQYDRMLTYLKGVTADD